MIANSQSNRRGVITPDTATDLPLLAPRAVREDRLNWRPSHNYAYGLSRPSLRPVV